MAEQPPDHANVIAPPPLIYAAGLLFGFLLQWAYPMNFLPRKGSRAIGLLLVGVNFLIGFSAFKAMQRAQTSVRPDTPTTTLVTTGPFQYTRNPIYLSFTLFYAGISLIVNTLWPFLLLPVVLMAMNWGVIAREEHYLRQKFGQEYSQYMTRVRRWF